MRKIETYGKVTIAMRIYRAIRKLRHKLKSRKGFVLCPAFTRGWKRELQKFMYS